MRIGLMIGPERGRYATKVERLQADARWAEGAGLATVWIPQIPDEFDALTAAALVGTETSRIEVGTAVVPIQPRHPIALAQQILSVQAVCQGRLSVGLGVSHHWVIDEMLGYLRFVLDVARRGMAAGLSPLDAARQADLGGYAGLLDSERIVGNLHRAYAELAGAPRGAEIDLIAALTDMISYNGGRPLTCHA